MHRSTLGLAVITTLLITPSVFGQDATTTRPTDPDLLEDTTVPMDDRIDPSRMTEINPPALPEQVVLPKPPVHAIATDPSEVPISPEIHARAMAAIQSGLDALTTMQHENGLWLHKKESAPTDEPDRPAPVALATTAMALRAYAQADRDALEKDHVRRAMQHVLRSREADGGYGGGSLSNYVTSSVVSALSAFQMDEFADQIDDAVTALQNNQWDQDEGIGPRKDWFGGAGYGNRGRPDLSNTQMMLEALYDAGLSPDEPAFQRALVFLQRTQNLKETNDAAWATNDGGFVYTPANNGESMGSQAAGDGRYGELIPSGRPRSLRSYGSMTYAGFKSLLYAGLSADDVRVRAAFDWVRSNWTFEENPGLGQQGLYYYYHAMARALNVAQQHEITDTDGISHNWREEMICAIIDRQRDDGSWRNDEPRWMEGEREMATIFAVLALEEALKPVRPRE
ncbi:MAG: prenyltransferase/squalene oxidase repeat-containing protein [Planctomycetota bacterium]